MAPDCGSWGLPARSTSQRSYVNPMGCESYGFVDRGNIMVSRLVLCILLILSRNAFYLVEQPRQTLLDRHQRWQWFANRVSWVFEISFWMQLHGSGSPKPTKMMGNLRTINRLDKGKLTAKEKAKRSKAQREKIAKLRDALSAEPPSNLRREPSMVEGDKIRELLIKNGLQFPPVELQIKKKMVDTAFNWAAKNSLIRTSQIHGEEEAKLILGDNFSMKEEEGEEHSQTMNLTCEEPRLNFIADSDPDGSSFRDSTMPDLNSSASKLLQRGEDEGVSPGDQAAASSGSFKLVFPTIQENASAIAILPHFLEVCGRKLDNCTGVQDSNPD
ncbi:unnamed protein product [Durusdinium trenchii]|uniref:Uncharacterized protein n=1 Tax=Durusdinium trenchii TaxID=1381693 RepID=A0ABP0P472_9DINO